MMSSPELGTFLRSRRERLRPADVGLPVGGRRRTPGLRREEVAVLAFISIEYYVRLEQGRAPRPSSEVLAAIAGALRLTDAESDHLHTLAGVAPLRNGLHQRAVRPSILTLIERLPLTAAIVVSAAFDVLAWNRLAAALMEDFGDQPLVKRNLARRAFLDSPTTSASVAPMWGISDLADFRLGVVKELRATLARYPSDPDLVELVGDLQAGSPDFLRLWERQDVEPQPTLTKTFHHPVVGELTLNCDSLALVEEGQHLVLYSAPLGSSSADALALLGVIAPDAVPMRS